MWLSPKEYKRVGRILAEAREQAAVTQVQLAAKLRKPQSFVSSYEAGQRRLDVLELIRIAKELDADPVELFREIAGQGRARAKR